MILGNKSILKHASGTVGNLVFRQYNGKTIVFCADLLATAGHIPIPYVMGYDTRPLLTLDEKAKFMNAAADNNYYLFHPSSL